MLSEVIIDRVADLAMQAARAVAGHPRSAIRRFQADVDEIIAGSDFRLVFHEMYDQCAAANRDGRDRFLSYDGRLIGVYRPPRSPWSEERPPP
jgi:hypothetical protein